MERFAVLVEGVEGLVPGGEYFAGGGVEVVATGLVPDRQPTVVVFDLGGGWPPDLVVGRGEHLAQFGAGDRAPDRYMDMRGKAPLGFDGGEVLDVIPGYAAQVLNEPVEQGGEADGIAGGPLVVVGGRVGRGAVTLDAAIARAGEGEEHRGPECGPVRRGVSLADRGRVDLPPGQVGGVLAAPGGPVTPCGLGGHHLAAHTGAGDFLVQVGIQLIQLSRVLPGRLSVVACGLMLGALLDPHPLHLVGLVSLDAGLVVEVPPLPALGRAQGLGPLSAGGADRGEGVPARDEHLLDLAGLGVGPAELDRSHAPAVGDGQLADHIPG